MLLSYDSTHAAIKTKLIKTNGGALAPSLFIGVGAVSSISEHLEIIYIHVSIGRYVCVCMGPWCSPCHANPFDFDCEVKPREKQNQFLECYS